jgi:hypothetical protein
MKQTNDSLYGQAVEEGGIVDMFIDDIKDTKRKTNPSKNLPAKRKYNYCPNCGTMLPR